jgi:hypothetical protein
MTPQATPPMYNGAAAVQLTTPATADHPSRVPQLKVMPVLASAQPYLSVSLTPTEDDLWVVCDTLHEGVDHD